VVTTLLLVPILFFLDFIQSLPLVPPPLELALTDYPTGGSCYHGLWRGETAKFNTVDDLALFIRDDVQQFQRAIYKGTGQTYITAFLECFQLLKLK
jgi:hypothetical protein